MTNPYLSLEPRELAGVWGMRAAELLPADEDSDATEGANRDTALMLLAGAMNVADREIQVSYGHCILDADRRLHQRRIRFEVLKRAAFLAIPEHPELWLLDAHSKGLTDIQHALDSDEGLCAVLRHLQEIARIGGRWHGVAPSVPPPTH